MGVVTSDLLAALTTNYRVIFKKTLAESAVSLEDYKALATIFTSGTDKETYNWLGEHPSMEEWKDNRQLRGLRDWDYTLTNKSYEATIQVDRETLEDDKYNMYMPRIQGLARASLRSFNEKVFTQLDDGESLACFDSGYFFADTRTIGASANIDNILAGNYSDSAAEIRAGIKAAVKQMRAFQDDWGKPMNLMPDTVVCSPEMEIPLKDALLPGVAGTKRPELEYVKKIIVSPWIDADTDDWFLLCTTGEVKPVIFQLRKAPEFNSLDDPKSSYVFLKKKFLFGVDARFEVGFGDPRTAILMHNT